MELERKIETYLSGEMTDQELAAFQELLDNDPELQKEVQSYREVDAYLGLNDWPQKSNNLDQKEYAVAWQSLQARKVPEVIDQVLNKQPRSSFSFWPLMAAASVILIIGLGWFFWQPSPTYQELFLAYYDPTELPSYTERGTETENQVARLYQQGDYDRLIIQMEETDEPKAELMLYYGVALLATNREEEAIDVFKEFVQSPLLDAQKGYWYMGLAYLKNGEEDLAIGAFRKLIASGSKYKQEETRKLIKALR